MVDVDYGVDKFGRTEAIRFLKWCIANKEKARKLFDIKHPITEEESRHLIHSLELVGLYTTSIIYQLFLINDNEIVETLLDTDEAKLNCLMEDYLPVGVSDYLSFVNGNPGKSIEEFKAFWNECIEKADDFREYESQTVIQWLENEWYEWEYICHSRCPKPEILEALYKKMSILAINDPCFLVVKAFIQECFYEFRDDEWVLKPYILASKEIEEKYGSKYDEEKEIYNQMSDKYNKEQ